MNRTDRMYAIVETLRARGRRGYNTRQLAEKFEVSVRTVKRDLAALQAAGTPIEGQDGRGGGYRLIDDLLPPAQFTSGEVAALAVAVYAASELPFAADGRAALTKLARSMNDGQRSELDDLLRRIWIRPRAPTGRAGTRASVRTIDEALRHRVSLSLDYEDRQGKFTRKRRVDPLAIARTGGVWYLLAWCHKSEAGRWFRFDRIRRANLTRQLMKERSLGEVFQAPPDDAQPLRLLIGR